MSLATPEKIRTLQRKLYRKAKAEPAFRFYLLYDKIYREDILRHAYAVARANAGAPGVDGVTFAQIEASGLEAWLAGLREELVSSRSRIARRHWRGCWSAPSPACSSASISTAQATSCLSTPASSASKASCRSAADRGMNPADRAIGSRSRTLTTRPCCGCSRRTGMADQAGRTPPVLDPDSVPETLCDGAFNIQWAGNRGTHHAYSPKSKGRPSVREGRGRLRVGSARAVATIGGCLGQPPGLSNHLFPADKPLDKAAASRRRRRH